MKDPYETLGVPRDASNVAIKRAYRRRAKATHPDRSGGDEDAFKSLASAYALLADPESRAHYDRTGRAPDPRGAMSMPEQIILQVLHMSIIASGNLEDVIGDLRSEIAGRLAKHRQNFDLAREGESIASEQLGRYRLPHAEAAEDNLIEGAFAQLVNNARKAQEGEAAAVKAHEDALTLLARYEDLRPVEANEDYAARFVFSQRGRTYNRRRANG